MPNPVDPLESARYFISSFSGGGNCVAVAMLADGRTAVRHSRQARDPIVFSAGPWSAFLAGVKQGELTPVVGAEERLT